MKLKFKNFAPAIVLGIICLVVAALLAAINYFTAPEIEKNERIARTESLTKAFPEGSGVEFDLPIANLPDDVKKLGTVTEIYPELSGKGYAVTLEFSGYADKIGLTVGVDKDGKVAGVVVTKSNETKGKSEMYTAVGKLAGKSENEISGVTLVTGATFSSDYIKDAVKDALTAAKVVKKAGLTASLTSTEVDLSTDEQIAAKTVEFGMANLAGAVGFTEVDLSDKEFLFGIKKIYEEDTGKGYAAFFRTKTQYVPRECDVLMTLDESFKIVNLEIVYWSLSPSYQEEVQIFLDNPAVVELQESFKGTDITTLGTEVDLVSKATSTSYNIYNSVTEILDYFTAEKIGEYVKDYAASKIEGAVDFELVEIPKDSLKKSTALIYRETTGKGYAVYCTTATQYNPDETRFVFILDSNFTVTDVDIWRWSTGVYDGATFPSSDEIEEKLEQSLIEVNKTTFTDKVDLISHSTGTSGNVMAAIAEAIDFLDTKLEDHILTFGASVLEVNKTDFTPVDISAAGLNSGIKRIYKSAGGGYVVYAVTRTQYNPMEAEFVFVLSENMRVLDFDLWLWTTGTYDGMTPIDSPKIDLLEQSFVGVTDLNIDYRVDLVTAATGTTNNIKAAVLEAISYLGTPSDTNLWQTVGIVALCLGIVAIGVGIYTQRRRRI